MHEEMKIWVLTLQNVHGHFNPQLWLSQLHVWSLNIWHWTDVTNVYIMLNLDILQESKGLSDRLISQEYMRTETDYEMTIARVNNFMAGGRTLIF